MALFFLTNIIIYGSIILNKNIFTYKEKIMKKKLLLLTVLVIALSCLFAIGVSAAEPSSSDAYGEITLITDNDAINNKDDYGYAEGDHARVVVKVPGTETYLTYPAYYVFDFRDDGANKYGWQPVLNMNYLKDATGLEYDATSIIHLEIPNFFTAVSTSYSKLQTCTSMKSVYMQSNMWLIHGKAFAYLPALESVVFEGSTDPEARSVVISERSFDTCPELKTVVLPANLEVTGTAAFLDCKKLTTVTVPENNRITTVSHRSFDGCSSLTGILEFDNVTTVGTQAFRYCATNDGCALIIKLPSVVTLGASSGDTHVFSYSKGLKEVYLGSSMKEMSYNTFTDCTGLEKVQIDAVDPSFTAIPSYTFVNCSSLKAFSIPEGIKTLPNRMFLNCTNLKAVYLPSTLTAINSGETDHATFRKCINLYFVDKPFTFTTDADIPTEPEIYYFPAGLTTVTSEAFDSSRLNNVVVFPTGVTSLTQGYTFEGCTSSNGKPTVVFMGDMQALEVKGWSVNAIYFCNKNDVDATSAGLSGSQTVYFCNAEDNTNHLQEKIVETSATCTLNEGTHKLCFCGFVMESTDKEGGEKALGHTSEGATVVMYFPLLNGAPNYFEDAHNKYTCPRCSEEQDEVAEGTALFVGDRGYSYEENGTSIVYRLHVNVENIKAYSGAFRYGIIVSGAPSTAPITLVDGAITYGAQTLVFEMQSANYEFDYIQAKVTNIGESTLNCQAYAIDNNVVTYIGHNNVNTLAEIVTYDAIFKAYGTTSGETKEN